MPNQVNASPFERVAALATRSEPLTQTDKSQIFAHAATLTLAEYEGASLTNNRLKSLLLAIGKQQETALKCFVASSSESTTTTHSSFVSRRLSDSAFGTSSKIGTFERNERPQLEHTPPLTQPPTCLSGLAQKSIEKLEKTQVKDHEKSPAAGKKIASGTEKPSSEPNMPKEPLSCVSHLPHQSRWRHKAKSSSRPTGMISQAVMNTDQQHPAQYVSSRN